jgi:hypothetical protein
MIKMFVRHDVADYGKWKKAYDEFDAERRGMGVAGDAVFCAVDNDKDVTATHDFESMDKAKAFVESPRLKEVMKAAGVTGPPTIWFTNPS